MLTTLVVVCFLLSWQGSERDESFILELSQFKGIGYWKIGNESLGGESFHHMNKSWIVFRFSLNPSFQPSIIFIFVLSPRVVFYLWHCLVLFWIWILHRNEKSFKDHSTKALEMCYSRKNCLHSGIVVRLFTIGIWTPTHTHTT